MTLGICELLQIKQVLEDLKIRHEDPMELLWDNKSPLIFHIIMFNMT